MSAPPIAFFPSLEPERVRAALVPHLLPGRNIESIVVQDARYRPRGETWFLYRVEMADPAGVSVHVAARLLSRDDTPRPPEPAHLERYRTWTHAVFQEPWFAERALSLEFYAFPVDPGMPLLFEAADPDGMMRHLAPFVSGARIRSVTCRNRSYLPYSRATFAYDVEVENGTRATRRLVGKMQSGKPARPRFDRHHALWSVAQGRLSIPRPVGVAEEAGVALQEHAAGERLGALVDRPEFEALVREAARTLAVLHQLRLPAVKERRPVDEARTVNRWSDLLRALRPDLASRITLLEASLTRLVLRNTASRALIHADFHHTNVLVDGHHLTFIDFDDLAMGDPMVDVGRFMASLRIPALRAFGKASALEQAGNAFMEEYLRAAGGHERRARLFEAASLLIAAGSAFRLQRPHWPEDIEILVETCERLITDVRRHLMNRIAMSPPEQLEDATVPHVLRDLSHTLADRARGKTLIVGPQDGLLARALKARGTPVIAISDLDALRQTSETATTVILREVMEHLDETAGTNLLDLAWERIRPGGRLIVVVPNGTSQGYARRFSRRSLRHELRRLGRPEMGTDQPFRWLVMIVRKPGAGRAALSRTNRQRARVTVKLCRGSVIDLGCGEGHLAGLLIENGHNVTGIDKNKEKIQTAARLYPRATFIAGDIRSADLPEASFDTALLTEVLEHLSEEGAREAVESAMRLLKRGGRLVVSVPNEDCVPHRNHLQEFDRWSLRTFLEPYGRTKLVTEQPYKWLLMVVEKP
jgi:2-polyprenyl-3-methyl-5-hydroxy-6-metoxy-1,4-benzoquinol methylase/aminoglycoside phosphotransferase (APT) family kinase protein